MPPNSVEKASLDKVLISLILLYRIGMGLRPMPRYIDAPAHPDPVMGRDVIEETAQGGKAAGPADQAAMQPDRQHFRGLRALLIEDVETVFEIGQELLAG